MHPRRAFILFEVVYAFGQAVTYTSYAPYLQQIGLSPAEVTLVNLWYFVALLVGEMPTGIFADRVSRVLAVRIGILITAASSALYATATGFLTATLYEVLIGVGMSFISGALNAWIKDAHHARREPEAEYSKTIFLSRRCESFATLIGGVSGGLVGINHPRLTWGLSGVLLLIPCYIALRHMTEERHYAPPQSHLPATRRLSLKLIVTDILLSVRILRQNHILMWTVAACMSLGLLLPFNHFWTPFFDARIGALNKTLLWVPIMLAQAFGTHALVWLRLPLFLPCVIRSASPDEGSRAACHAWRNEHQLEQSVCSLNRSRRTSCTEPRPCEVNDQLSNQAAMCGASITKNTETNCVIGVILLIGVGLTLMGGCNSLPVIVTALMLYQIGRGMFFPLMEVFLQKRIDSSTRATYTSFNSLLTRIGYVGVLTVVSQATQGKDWDLKLITGIWMRCGSLLILTAILLYLFVPKRARS